MAAAATASGLGGSWNDGGGPSGAGILGESFHGIPLLGFAEAAAPTDWSSPAAAPPPPMKPLAADTVGGITVRAVSSSFVAGAPAPTGALTRGGELGAALGAGVATGAGLASSLPHPRQNL